MGCICSFSDFQIPCLKSLLTKAGKLTGFPARSRKDVCMENYSKEMLPKDYEFNLSDFALFLSVMKNKEAYQCVLSIIMDETYLELKEVKVEQVILNEKGLRAIRLDAWAMDRKNRQFNI